MSQGNKNEPEIEHKLVEDIRRRIVGLNESDEVNDTDLPLDNECTCDETRKKFPGNRGASVIVCAGVEVARVPSSMPRDPRSRVTSRVVIRDHRSPIRRNKTRQTRTSRSEPRFPGSADREHLLSLFASSIWIRWWLTPSRVSQSHLVRFFSFMLPS